MEHEKNLHGGQSLTELTVICATAGKCGKLTPATRSNTLSELVTKTGDYKRLRP